MSVQPPSGQEKYVLTLECFLFLIRNSHGFPSKPIWQTQWWLPSVLIQSVFAPHCFPPSEHSSMSRQPEPSLIWGALDNKHDSYQNIFYGLCSLSYIHTLVPWCRRHCWHSSCGCHNTQTRPIVGLHSRSCHTIPICPMVEKGMKIVQARTKPTGIITPSSSTSVAHHLLVVSSLKRALFKHYIELSKSKRETLQVEHPPSSAADMSQILSLPSTFLHGWPLRPCVPSLKANMNKYMSYSLTRPAR